ncbi:hypothetical protein AZE42_09061, partial [Rhizopogon vesiculosus]
MPVIGENDSSSSMSPLEGLETKQDLVTSHLPLLPVEILDQILQPQWKQCEDINTWREMANVMLSCSLTSRTLHTIARACLYNDIRLYRHNSLCLFLRTVRESFGGHCPAHALHFVQVLPSDHHWWAKQYAMLAEEIISCCTELRYLEFNGARDFRQFTSGRSLPEYPFLKKLEVSDLSLHFLAPLLPRFRNLESFEVLRCDSRCDLVKEHLPPSFKLLTLSISHTRLSRDQCKWLFASSSQSIESLEVHGADESLGPLADVMGGFVKKLHTSHFHDRQVIPRFRDNMQSSLKTFAFSWSRET